MTSQECIQRKTDKDWQESQAFILVSWKRESEGLDIVDAPSPQKLIFDGLMSSQISEIESLGGHTYNRPELLHKLLHKQKQT